jgi:hypothetical protein
VNEILDRLLYRFRKLAPAEQKILKQKRAVQYSDDDPSVPSLAGLGHFNDYGGKKKKKERKSGDNDLYKTGILCDLLIGSGAITSATRGWIAQMKLQDALDSLLLLVRGDVPIGQQICHVFDRRLCMQVKGQEAFLSPHTKASSSDKRLIGEVKTYFIAG